MTGVEWFGGILSWRRSKDGWEARHGGRLHEIVKLDRRDADQQQTSPGWHLVHHEPGAAWCGPHLGRTRDRALMMAEAHILVPYREWFATDDAPGFISAMSGAGAAWGTHRLIARPHHELARILACRSDAGDAVVGEVRPHFLIEGDPALEPVHILWTPQPESSPRLSAEMSWHHAAEALAHAVNGFVSPTA